MEKLTLSDLSEKWLPEMGPDDVFIKGANAMTLVDVPQFFWETLKVEELGEQSRDP